MDMSFVSAQAAPIFRPAFIPGVINTGITFKQAAQSYAENGGEAKFLPRIIEYFGDRAMASICPADAIAMANTLYPDHANSTKNRQALSPMSAVFGHAYNHGWCSLIRLKRFKQEKPKPRRAATFEWMVLFLRQCIQDNLPHLAAYAVFTNRTAARVSEAIRLTWDDVDIDGRRAILRKTKTGRNSVRTLTDDVIAFFRRLRPALGERVFKYISRHSVQERINAVCLRAGIEILSTHQIGRKAFAENIIEAGVDIKTAMVAGGWECERVFLGYLTGRDAGTRVAEVFNRKRYGTELWPDGALI